ncbi:MAG: MarR family winged helix-turn-helix transcriptional regulator [Rectinemataceae bacterium]
MTIIPRWTIVVIATMSANDSIPEYQYSNLLGFLIIKGEVCIKRKLLGLFLEKGYNITFEQWTVLNVLLLEPDSTQNDIACRTYKDKTNITRILEVLERNGLIHRVQDGADKRISRVHLSDAGIEMMKNLIPSVRALNKQLRKGISDEELSVFRKIIERIHHNAE